MMADLLALLDKPLVLLIVMAIGGVIGIALENALNRIDREKRKAYWRGRNSAKARPAKGGIHLKDLNVRPIDAAADQLKVVMNSAFTARRCSTSPKRKCSRRSTALSSRAIRDGRSWRRCRLGEFLACPDSAAFGCINSKRVDFALMDGECRVRHALEYQGTGHHQGTAAARDAVKKEALRKAAIGYHEIVAGHTTPGELKRLIEKLVPVADGEKAA